VNNDRVVGTTGDDVEKFKREILTGAKAEIKKKEFIGSYFGDYSHLKYDSEYNFYREESDSDEDDFSLQNSSEKSKNKVDQDRKRRAKNLKAVKSQVSTLSSNFQTQTDVVTKKNSKKKKGF
jgi:hypothetical protein